MEIMQKYICLINNYNYAKYLSQCLDSVFKQSTPFHKVIVVDDGSIDGSKDIIAEYQKNYVNLYAILKKNGGQLSTFNASLEFIEDNSQIFLLDSDDIYPSNYLEICKKMVGHRFPDFTYSSALRFTDESNIKINTAEAKTGNNELFTKTSALTRSRRCWIGNPTSCISLSSELFKKILPYPYPDDFKTRADDAIIFASSLVGAQKLALLSVQIGYRMHQDNNFSGKKISESQAKKHDDAINRLFNYYCYNFQLDENPSVKEFFSELNLLNKSQKNALRLPNYYKLWNRLIRKRYFKIFERF
jgi:glycosyltransferase involved in cell wall biosynthesis